MAIVNWGVDSASQVTEALYTCVVDAFGKPDFWGRYLNEVPNVNDGLTREEISLIHNKGMKLLPIYNNFSEAAGERAGTVAARNAVYRAQRLEIKKGSFIFANIEHFFDVDQAWITAWVNTMTESPYRPGLYGDPDKGQFHEAYCEAVKQSRSVGEQAVIWSAEPHSGVTTKRKFPRFAPSTPTCKANVWAWQYGRDAEACPIDTVLMKNQLYETLA